MGSAKPNGVVLANVPNWPQTKRYAGEEVGLMGVVRCTEVKLNIINQLHPFTAGCIRRVKTEETIRKLF